MDGFADPRTFTPPSDAAEFEDLMVRLDAWLEARKMSAAARQLAAAAELSYAVGRNGRIPHRRDPRPDRYDGEDLILHGAAWYEARYGSTLKVVPGAGRTVVELRSDLYVLRLPLVVGRAWIRCSAENYPRSPGQRVARGDDGVPILNALDYVEDMTRPLAASMGDDELDTILTAFRAFIPMLGRARLLGRPYPLIVAALADSESAVHSLTFQPPHYGSSQWASLQVAEKSLKAYTKARTGSHRGGHDLSKALEDAYRAGLKPVPAKWIVSCQCEASVRYGAPEVSREKAVDAHYSSLRILGAVSEALYDTEQRPNEHPS
jgi:hypothetical protein